MTKNIKESEKSEQTEKKLVKRFLLFSVLGHLSVAILYIIKLPSHPKPIQEIEAELVLTTALDIPKKKQDKEKTKVEKNTLPQISKNLIIKQDREKESIAIDSLKEARKKKARKKLLKKMKYIEISRKEALKKLQRERARRRKAFARKEKLKLNESLKQIKSLSDNIVLNAGVSDGNYKGVIRSWIEKHYEIPDSYDLSNKNIEILIEIFLDRDGEVINIKVKRPSRSPIFNKIAVQTIRKSSPLPKPPIALVHKSIQLTFTPSKG